jgi:hypothetical protein
MQMTAPTLATTVEIVELGAVPGDITDHEGCDRCGDSVVSPGTRIAPPQVRVTLVSGGQLVFCKHHANRYLNADPRVSVTKPALLGLAAKIEDWSGTINSKPSTSANAL